MSKGVYIVALSLLLGAQSVAASDPTLTLSPRTGTYPIGEEFSVTVRVDTGGSAIGSADVTIGYDPVDLTFVSYATEGSVFSSIIKDEDRSTYGRIRLQGIVSTNRGPYTGSDGLFATLTFRPVRNTATQVWFAEGAATPLVASVGQIASNILTAPLQSATYTLVPRETVPAAVSFVPSARGETTFEITTQPEPLDTWFSTSTVTLSWQIPDGVTAMRTGVSADADGTPAKLYPIPVSSVTVSDLEDGEQYFHLQFRFGETWATTVHHKLNVDTSAPEQVTLMELVREDVSDPRVQILVEAEDVHSGVVRFEVGIDGESPTEWERPENGVYHPTGLVPGEHTLTVTAFDRVENSTSADILFLVRSLEPPTLVRVPDRILTGDMVTVEGTTYPNASVTVFISLNDGEVQEKLVKSDGEGIFRATIAEGARAGKYTLWFSVTDERGASSPPSIKRSVTVSQPFIMLFGSVAVTYLSVIVPLVALIVILALTLWLGFTALRGYRRRVQRETNEAYTVVHEEFAHLRKDLVRQIGMLEKANQSRELTREEMRILNELSERLHAIEEHIAREIDDIAPVAPRERYAHGVDHDTIAEYQQVTDGTMPPSAPPSHDTGPHVVQVPRRRTSQ